VPHPHRRAHVRAAALAFAGLGLQVGAWAVLVADLAAGLRLSPGELGLALAAGATGGLTTLVLGGLVVDRTGRRPFAVGGLVGLALAYLLLARVGSLGALVAVGLLYGAAGGLLDLGANALGADVERAARRHLMTRLQAAFSAAAAVGALASGLALAAGAAYGDAYVALAVALLAVAAVLARAPLPPPAAGDGHGAPPPGGARRLLALPGVALGTGVVVLCFLGDGAIEGYSGLYLRSVLESGPLLAGLAFGAFHLAMTAGRLGGAVLIARVGERRVLGLAGTGASAAMALTAGAQAPALAGAGLLLVGLALAPVVPIALSVAARGAGDRAGAAVSVVVTAGYLSFIAGPPLVGLLAEATSLRAALAVVVVTTAAIALLSRRLP